MKAYARSQQVATQDRSAVEPTPRLLAAQEALAAAPDAADLWLEKGHALGEMGLFREAIEAFSRGIAVDPFHGPLYRWRAHRHLSCWEISEASADFTMAARLIPGDWDVWYHYALSWYLRGEYDRAATLYAKCLSKSAGKEEKVATSEWYYTTLMRLGDRAKAQAVLDAIPADYSDEDCDDSIAYYRRLLMHKGLIAPESLLDGVAPDDTVGIITRSYGLANYYAFRGDRTKADEVLDNIVAAGQDKMWNAFGYIAAMVDRKGLKS